jgi:hypothetical protein
MSDEGAKWEDQWGRVKRLGDWVDEIYSSANTLDQDKSSDVVNAFFINCFHLKDWLSKHDGELYSDVEQLFAKGRGEIHMQLCADIANQAKHFQLDNRRRTQQDAQIVARSVNVHQGAGVAYEFKLGEYDAQDSKNACLGEWDRYIHSKLGHS